MTDKFLIVGDNSGKEAEVIERPRINELNKQLENEAISLATSGMSLNAICKELNISNENMRSYLNNNLSFKTKFNDAREDGYDALADQLLTITNEESDHNKAKVKSDNIKWLLSKRKANVYGDKIEVNMNATIDIGATLAEAKARASATNKKTIDISSNENSIESIYD